MGEMFAFQLAKVRGGPIPLMEPPPHFALQDPLAGPLWPSVDPSAMDQGREGGRDLASSRRTKHAVRLAGVSALSAVYGETREL
jgi:hypothetical protein